jgi:hypothetical protein
MIKAFPGGWEGMAWAMGMSRSALENRIYERKGQALLVEHVIQMQHFSWTTLFAEEVAKDAGGFFMKMPEINDVDREDLLLKFNELYAELGELSTTFKASISDDEIDHDERNALTKTGSNIHRALEEMLALTFQIYCRQGHKD